MPLVDAPPRLGLDVYIFSNEDDHPGTFMNKMLRVVAQEREKACYTRIGESHDINHVRL